MENIPPIKTQQKNMLLLPNLLIIGNIHKHAKISKIAANEKLEYGLIPISLVFIPKP